MPSLALDTPDLAETYDVVSDKQYEHGKLLIAALAIRPGDQVLDVGCGTGRLGEYVASEIVGSGGRVVGIDPLPLRIAIARRRASPNHRAEVGRSDDLSAFADNSFDIVYLNSVYHWLTEKLPTLREARRVLKPGGRLGISVASGERPHDIQRILAAVLAAHGIAQADGGSTPHRVSVAQLAAQHEEAGFLVDEIRVRSFNDRFADADEVFAFNQSSSFGNFLTGYPEETRQRVHAALAAAYERRRTPRGIELVRNLLFSVASKPGPDSMTVLPAAASPLPSTPASTDPVGSGTELLRRRYGADAIPAAAAALAGDSRLAAILGHRSVRRFRPDPLAPGVLELLVAAAQSASTSSHLQPWSVVAIEDAQRKARAATIAGEQEFIRQAPLFLVFIADLSRLAEVSARESQPGAGLDYLELFLIAAIDATLAAQNAVVAAETIGLGTCYVGAARNRPQDLADLLGLPPRAVAIFGLAVGHPRDGREAVKPRLPQHEVLHRETYSSAGRDAALTAYDATMAGFYRSQGQAAAGWSRHMAERVATVEALRGRHLLHGILQERGFPLR